MSEITPEYIAHLRELDKKASVSSASSDEVYLHIHAATTALPSLLDEIERLWSRLTDAANADVEKTREIERLRAENSRLRFDRDASQEMIHDALEGGEG